MKTLMKRLAMKKRSIVAIMMLISLTFASIGFPMNASAAEESKTIRLAFTDAPTLTIGDMTIYHPSYAAMLAFKGAFEKSTGGEYTVELYANGILGDASSTLEQIITGTFEGSTPADGALSAFAPNIQVFSIPYLFSNPTIAYDVLDGEFGQKLFGDIAKESGLRVVASYDNGGYRNFTNSVKEVKTAADLKGLNIRVMDSPVYIKLVEALGASATPVAFLELYSALQTGVVDAQENSAVTTLGASLDEVQPFCTLDGHLLGLAFLTVGNDWYNSLDAKTQAFVDEAGREASIAARGTCRFAEALAISTMTEKGVKVYSPSAEELETFKVSQKPVIEFLNENVSEGLVDVLFTAIENVENGVESTSNVSTDTPAATDVVASETNDTSKESESSSPLIPIVIIILALTVLIVVFMAKRKKK